MCGVMQNVVISGIRQIRNMKNHSRRDRRIYGHHMKGMVGNGNNR